MALRAASVTRRIGCQASHCRNSWLPCTTAYAHHPPLWRAAKREFSSVEAERAKFWITRGGSISARELQLAEDRVHQSGVSILPASASTSNFIRERIFSAVEWKTAYGEVTAELALTSTELPDPTASQPASPCEIALFTTAEDGSVLDYHYKACRIAQTAGHIHCVYGRYQMRVETAGPGVQPPPEHCVHIDGRTYSVLPSRSPKDMEYRQFDMCDNWYDLPGGWKAVDASSPDFARVVLPKVIAGNGWGTDWAVTWKDDKWVAWQTGASDGAIKPGSRANSNVEFFNTDASGRRCVYRGWPARLLLEQVPRSEMHASLRNYTLLKAQAEWARELGVQSKEANERGVAHASSEIPISLADRMRRVKPPTVVAAAAAATVPSVCEAGDDDDDDDGNLYEEPAFDNQD